MGFGKSALPKDFYRALNLLSKRDQRNLGLVAVIQILFGLLDLAGVAFVGMLTALAIRGIQSQGAGDRVSQVLSFLQLENQEIKIQILVLGVLSVIAFVLKTIFSVYFLRRTLRHLSYKSAEISSSLFSRLMGTSVETIASESRQQRLYAITTGVTNITVGVLTTSVLIIADTSLLLVLTVGLLILDPLICVITLGVFSIIGVTLFYLTHSRAQGLGSKFSSTAIESNQEMLEAMEGFREIFVRGALPHFTNRIRSHRIKLSEYDAEIKFLPNVSKYVTELAIVVGALLVCTILFSVNDTNRAIAVLAVFMAASTRIAPAVMRLQQGAISVKSNLSTAESTLDLADELSETALLSTTESTFGRNHENFKATVLVEEAYFTYTNSNLATLKNISLEILEGEMVALVGPSGGGKSTLVDIILGISKPQQGKVLVSGREPTTAIQSWPGAIGYVPQEVFISNNSIRENITIGFDSKTVADEYVWEAIEQAELAEFVRQIPDQLDYAVGESGSNLSGGQKQRIGIARALVSKPSLIIFDEATSNLDSETEKRLSDSILKLKGMRTLIIVAHRLSTVRDADRVIYLDNGVISGSGTFDELRSNNEGFAANLRNMGL